ncbi:MAG: thiol reductant ABC exporter subunit CydC, partial [Anaerolineae bacterium]|nr:thiol reductant ABC exporter subunit CydC [Anaerolineae bacterium]
MPDTRPTLTPPPPSGVLRHLIGLALPFWRWMLASVVLGFLTIGASIGLMATSAWIIARAALHPSVAVLQVAIVGVRFFGITRGLFRYLERLASHEATFRLLARVRVWFYARLEPLAPARLQAYRSGDLLSRITTDVDTLEDFYVRVLAPPVVALLVLLLMMAFLGSFAPELALALVIFWLLAGVGVPLLARVLSRAPGRAMIAARAELNAALVDGVQGLADALAYGAGQRQAEHVAALSRALIAQQRRLTILDGLQDALGVLLVTLAMLAVLALAIPVVAGVNLAAVSLAVIASFEAVLPLAGAFQSLESTLAAGGRLMEVIAAAPAVTDPADPVPAPPGGDLVVAGLRFAYTAPPSRQPAVASLPPHGGKGVSVARRNLSPSLFVGEGSEEGGRWGFALDDLTFTLPAGGRI